MRTGNTGSAAGSVLRVIAFLLAAALAGTLTAFLLADTGAWLSGGSQAYERAFLGNSRLDRQMEQITAEADRLSERYQLPEQLLMRFVNRENLEGLDRSALKWWADSLGGGLTEEPPKWNETALRDALMEEDSFTAGKPTSKAKNEANEIAAAMGKAVNRSVLPLRTDLMEAAVRKIREKADPALLAEWLRFAPGILLAAAALVTGGIVLLLGRRPVWILRYIGIAAGAACLLTVGLGLAFRALNLGETFQEASPYLADCLKDLAGEINRRLILRLTIPAAVSVSCFLLQRKGMER